MWLTSVISLDVDEGDKIKPKCPREVKLVFFFTASASAQVSSLPDFTSGFHNIRE